MRYLFFICKAKYTGIADRLFQTYHYGWEEQIESKDIFLPYDMDCLFKFLRRASGESKGLKPIFKFRQLGKLPVVLVATEYSLAQKVAEKLSRCVGGQEKFLFDAEMKCSLDGIRKPERLRFIMLRLVYQRYTIAIRNKFNSNHKKYSKLFLYKLGERYSGKSKIDTCLYFKRGKLEDGVVDLYESLCETAKEHGENVFSENGYFVVENRKMNYQLRFVLEGTGKFPMYMGWMENGKVKLELLRRMGVVQAARRIREMEEGEEEYIRSRLYFNDQFPTREEWNNPADRFIDSFKMSLWLKRQNLDIVYGEHPQKHYNEFLFFDQHVSSEAIVGWDEWKISSHFYMTGENALPLLALIADIIPYYWDYYYDTFFVRKEEIERILKRLKVVRKKVINNPSDPSLGKITEWLMKSDYAYDPIEDMSSLPITEDMKRECLFRHRFEIVALFDFFEKWIIQRKDSYTGFTWGGFYVMGP